MWKRWLGLGLALGMLGCGDDVGLVEPVGMTAGEAYVPANYRVWKGWCYADGPEWLREGAFVESIRHEHDHQLGDRHTDDSRCQWFVSALDESVRAKLCRFERVRDE
jgi:hypothetical protein